MRTLSRISVKLMENIISDSQDQYNPSKFRTLKTTNKKIEKIYLKFINGKKVSSTAQLTN
jgi:hypothetical protein